VRVVRPGLGAHGQAPRGRPRQHHLALPELPEPLAPARSTNRQLSRQSVRTPAKPNQKEHDVREHGAGEVGRRAGGRRDVGEYRHHQVVGQLLKHAPGGSRPAPLPAVLRLARGAGVASAAPRPHS
jgi:hypothetical protein